MINRTIEVIFCSFEKYEKFLMMRDVRKKAIFPGIAHDALLTAIATKSIQEVFLVSKT